MNLMQAFERWRQTLGADAVLGAEQAQAAYSACTTGRSRQIAGALRPGARDQIPSVLKIASEEGVPIYPVSTGRNWGYGSANPVQDGCVVLDLGGLRQIVELDAELGVVTLEPGVTQADLSSYLLREGLPFLVPVTGAGPSCSILANALERGYGVTPWADHFAAVTAIEAVLSDGRVFRSALSEMGASRVDRLFKWGIGPYLDGMFTQSGCGVVTAMSVALARKPETIAAGFFNMRDPERFEALVECVRNILSRHPGIIGGMNLMNRHRVLSMSVPYPADRLGPDGVVRDEVIADLGRKTQTPAWTGFVTLYGTPGVVRAAKREIRRAIWPLAGPVMFFSPEGAARLAGVARACSGVLPQMIVSKTAMLAKSLQLVAGQPNETAMPLAYWRSGRSMPSDGSFADPARDRCGLLWYAPLVPMTGAVAKRFVAMVHQITRKHGMEPLITLTTLSDRVFDSTVPLVFQLDSAQQTAAAHACYDELLEAGKLLGCLPYRVGVGKMDWLTSQPGVYWDVVSALKATLDPGGIIAPGRYAPGLEKLH